MGLSVCRGGDTALVEGSSVAPRPDERRALLGYCYFPLRLHLHRADKPVAGPDQLTQGYGAWAPGFKNCCVQFGVELVPEHWDPVSGEGPRAQASSQTRLSTQQFLAPDSEPLKTELYHGSFIPM